MEIDIRPHGDYRHGDWWLRLFAWVTRLVAPAWHRRWVDHYVTVSVITRTIYGTPSPVTIDHELVHIEQYERDGWMMPLRYVLSRRWRIRYETEAYQAQGWQPERIAVTLAEGYLLAMSSDRVFGYVVEDYKG